MKRRNLQTLGWMTAAGTVLTGGSSLSAAPDKPASGKKEIKTPFLAQVLSVKASVSGSETLVDIALKGATAPLLSQKGSRVTLLLPGTIPAAELASRLESGGIVNRIGVEVSPLPERDSRLTLDLDDNARCLLVASPDKKNLRLRISPEAAEKSESPFTLSDGHFDVDAYQTDLSSLLTSLAKTVGGSVAMLGVSPKVTAQLKRVTFEQAVAMLSKSAGMTFRKEGDTFIVGGEKEMASAYPTPKPQDPPLSNPVMRQEVYHCKYIVASALARSIQSLFEEKQIKVGVGADHLSPTLIAGSTGGSGAVTGLSSSAIAAAGGSGGGASSSASVSGASTGVLDGSSREVILYGEQTLVERALDLAKKLDVKRRQVRINVRISDVSSDALRELGIRWNWSHYTAKEVPSASSAGGTGGSGSSGSGGSTTTTDQIVNGIGFKTFGHTPIYIDAQLSALEQDNRAKLLAAPNLMLLDGERGFIQIGQRVLYPVVVSLSQTNQPNYSVQEQRVGIYLQVAVNIDDSDAFTITLYPQVSSITSYLNVNGGSYPQISTREAQTTIRLQNLQEIVIGGLIRDEEINTKEAVPILSKIPFFGELFKYRKITRNKSEVILTITPEILKD